MAPRYISRIAARGGCERSSSVRIILRHGEWKRHGEPAHEVTHVLLLDSSRIIVTTYPAVPGIVTTRNIVGKPGRAPLATHSRERPSCLQLFSTDSFNIYKYIVVHTRSRLSFELFLLHFFSPFDYRVNVEARLHTASHQLLDNKRISLTLERKRENNFNFLLFSLLTIL